jgi:flagellar hook-associated protein FlgK
MGLNAALSMASRSLQVFSAGIEVAGQNISNAATPAPKKRNCPSEQPPHHRRT